MKRSHYLRQKGLILDDIMAWKRKQLPARKREMPPSDLRALARLMPATVNFVAALRRPGVQLIAEVKRASPSRGLIANIDHVELGHFYARNGAAAISVLTDERFFQGKLDYLTDLYQQLRGEMGDGRPPLLRKDFIFDPYQVWETRAAGADALLLIVAVHSDKTLQELLTLTHDVGLSALVETHNEEEVQRALAAGAKVIGINNRDLRNFQVSLSTTEHLRPLLPPEVTVVSESGISTGDDVAKLRAWKVDAMLVGETLVKAKDRTAVMRSLIKAGQAEE